MVNFMPQLLYPLKEPWYPLITKLGGPQSPFGYYRGEEVLLSSVT
jgi:hypothetical protein